eukprot:365509-Chlamydomonas_euryale.AAC.11
MAACGPSPACGDRPRPHLTTTHRGTNARDQRYFMPRNVAVPDWLGARRPSYVRGSGSNASNGPKIPNRWEGGGLLPTPALRKTATMAK